MAYQPFDRGAGIIINGFFVGCSLTFSVAKRAAELYWFLPVKLLIRDHYNSINRIKRIKAPLLIFHGREDTVIPPSHAQALYKAANDPKRIELFDGVGHTDFNFDLIAAYVRTALR